MILFTPFDDGQIIYIQHHWKKRRRWDKTVDMQCRCGKKKKKNFNRRRPRNLKDGPQKSGFLNTVFLLAPFGCCCCSRTRKLLAIVQKNKNSEILEPPSRSGMMEIKRSQSIKIYKKIRRRIGTQRFFLFFYNCHTPSICPPPPFVYISFLFKIFHKGTLIFDYNFSLLKVPSSKRCVRSSRRVVVSTTNNPAIVLQTLMFYIV